MDALETLLARTAIAEVKARYCRCLDIRDWDGFGAVFTDDAVMDVRDDTGAEPFHGRALIVDTVRAVVTGAKSVHQVHSPEISFDGPDAATVIWPMHDRLVWTDGPSPIPPVTAIIGYGHYHERYVRAGGQWRIASLKLNRLLVEMSPQPKAL